MFEISFYNLWLPFVLGYALIWGLMGFVDNRRGNKIEDREEYGYNNKVIQFIRGFLPTLGLIIISLFVPVVTSWLFIPGLILYAVGIIVNFIAIISFRRVKTGLNIGGIYGYSRNPMYVGGIFFITGLNLMSISSNIMSLFFLTSSLVWIITVHLHVLQEEKYLTNKYGQVFEKYLNMVPRYVGFIKKY